MNVTTGKVKKPVNVLLYGVDGIGKSTWASKAPSPIFLGPEDGTNNLDVARFNGITSWASAMDAANELMTADHPYQTLVIDTLDWMEILLFKNIIGKTGKNINTVNGGYGAGREDAKQQFLEFIERCSELRDHKKMNLIFLAHSEIENFTDPSLNEAYQRYALKLDKRTAGVFREFVDDVLFATYKMYVKKEDKGPTRTFGDGVRIVRTERRPAFDAKNRSGLPFEMALQWDDYLAHREKGEPESVEAIMQQIEGLLTTCKDQEFVELVRKTIANDPHNVAHLGAVANKLEVRLGE